MAGFGVDAAREASGRTVCVTSTGDEPSSVRFDFGFPGVTLCGHRAELFTRQLLRERLPDRRDVLQLVDLLPREESSRGNATNLQVVAASTAVLDLFRLHRSHLCWGLS